jgi:hypothetical protein
MSVLSSTNWKIARSVERANLEGTQLDLVSDRDECIAEVGETAMKARNRGVAHEQHNRWLAV